MDRPQRHPREVVAPAEGDGEQVVGIERLVTGGAGLAHEASGRVALVHGGLPGERVRMQVVGQRARMSTGTVLEVLEASPARVEPRCTELAAGCGGCDLQHAEASAQPALKVGIVEDAVARAVRRGDLGEVPVSAGVALTPWRYRSTVRCGVVGDRLAFRRRRSEDLLGVADCLVSHEMIAGIIRDGRFPGADEVTVRVGVRTGEQLVVVSPRLTGDVVVPEGVRVVGTDELRRGRRAWYHEIVEGHRYRISAQSFFQSGAEGADALVVAVRRALGPLAASDRVADLYAGVGLFARALGAVEPVVVERSASSVADARVNLAGTGARVVRSAVERWRPSHADLVVADPARTGLGRDGVRVVAATGARRLALVSCDVASLVRDLVLLAGCGYSARGIEVVDLFPNTHHVEVVTTLERT